MAGLDRGSLNRRITLQRAGSVTDSHGDQVEGYAEIATVSASAKPAPGSERLQSAEAAATAPMIFRIGYSPTVEDLNPKDRILFKGRVWSIASVVEIGMRDGLEITAVARAD
jgi:SPP1 family predicted phage head-tail adaptor